MKILALGTSCVDIYPPKGMITPGGEALNIAAHLSIEENVDVCIMGQIGQDQYGDEILKSIESLPINLNHLYRTTGETAHHIIKIKKDEDRYIEEGAWRGGVSSEYRLTGKDKELLGGADGVRKI